MDYKRKRITLTICLITNLLLLYFYYSEPDYFLSGADYPELAPQNLIAVNKHLSDISEKLFPLFSISFLLLGIYRLWKNEDFSILFFTVFFVIICFLNIIYRFF
jgi:hypothetical protein